MGWPYTVVLRQRGRWPQAHTLDVSRAGVRLCMAVLLWYPYGSTTWALARRWQQGPPRRQHYGLGEGWRAGPAPPHCRRVAGVPAPSAADPWAVLGLQAPGPGREALPLAEVRRAFRAAARRAHPDVPGGSNEAFRDVVQAYRDITDPSGSSSSRGTKGHTPWPSQDDGYASAWEDWFKEQQQAHLGQWQSFEDIERFTDDDDWGGREPLRNFFVTRHDATVEGGVVEGNVAIYRLAAAVGGCSWGVARVLALQVRYSAHGPNGIIHLQPLMHAEVGAPRGTLRLVEDSHAEVATVRAIDRFEVLSVGVQTLEDGNVTVAEGSPSHTRLTASGMVHIAEIPAEEYLYDCGA